MGDNGHGMAIDKQLTWLGPTGLDEMVSIKLDAH